jgi:hypothetical protein
MLPIIVRENSEILASGSLVVLGENDDVCIALF